MTVHYADDLVTLHHGDCLDVLRSLPDNSVDAVVTDPPYGLEFMGKEWDAPWKAAGAVLGHATERGGFQDGPNGGNPYSRSRVEFGRGGAASVGFGEWCQWTAECLRVLKPGGHLLAFGGTRTWHRLACAVEDAGFEVRDSIAWLYGSGFPKSLDVSKAIDKAAGATREPSGAPTSLACHFVRSGVPCEGHDGETATSQSGLTVHSLPTAPATDQARTWQGWGTALKPAFEPVVVARKPLAGTVSANVLAHGTGALNIDACRVGPPGGFGGGAKASGGFVEGYETGSGFVESGKGRWPANVVLDDTQAAVLDRQSGVSRDGVAVNRNRPDGGSRYNASGYEIVQGPGSDLGYGGEGGASRFFPTFRYEAKAPTLERPRDGEVAHPTVKPLDLMRWLVRLVTPPGGTVLEPFAGSGTTAEACVVEGFRCIAIEREATYLPLIVARLTKPIQPDLFGGAA